MKNSLVLSLLYGRRRSVAGLLTTAIMLVALLALFTNSAGAAYWNVHSQGDCASGYPRGDSWLNWDGYGPSATGNTDGTLFWYSGSQWIAMTQGGASYTGSPGNAQVTNTSGYRSGYWDETATHWSNFFSGYRYSDSLNWVC